MNYYNSFFDDYIIHTKTGWNPVKGWNDLTRKMYNAFYYKKYKQVNTITKDFSNREKEVFNRELDKIGGLKADSKDIENLADLFNTYEVLDHDETIEETRQYINENYDARNPNTSRNCIYCAEAYDLRRRGFDVKANEKKSEDNLKTLLNKDYNYTGQFLGTNAKNKKDVMLKELQKQGDGARGILGLTFTDGNSAGHAISYENKNGKTYFIDSQRNTKEIITNLDSYDKYSVRFYYIRLDDKIPNKNISNHVKNY